MNRYILIDSPFERRYLHYSASTNKSYFEIYDKLENEWLNISFTNGSFFNKKQYDNTYEKYSNGPYIFKIKRNENDPFFPVSYNHFREEKNPHIIESLMNEQPELFI
jgi:hypothetical protein